MIAPDARILALETSGQTGSVAIGTRDGAVAAERLPVNVRHAGELMPAVQRLLERQGWRADSITDVFLSIGPGSFTGLRIAVSIARTLAWSIGARIVAVPTMHALARNAIGSLSVLADTGRQAASGTTAGSDPGDAGFTPRPEYVAIIIDAKRAQVFTACYRLDGGSRDRGAARAEARGSSADATCVELVSACLAEPREFLSRCPKPLAVLGEGIPRHREVIEAAGATILPESLWAGRAENVLAVGLDMAQADEFTPARDLVPLYIRRPEMEERWEQRQGRGVRGKG